MAFSPNLGPGERQPFAGTLAPDHRYFESARLRLHYVVWGDESKPPLVLVHGGRDHCRNWDYVADGLVDRFAIYALDLRGHGDSDWAIGGAYRLSDFIVDLARFVEVIDRGPVHLIGHSLGARLVIDYTATFADNVTKFVPIEGFGRFASMLTAPERLVDYVLDVRDLEKSRPRYYRTLEEATGRMQQANRRLTPAMARHLTEHAVRRLEDGTYMWKFDPYVRLQQPQEWTLEETREIWSQVRAPSVHIGGSESWGRRPPFGGSRRAQVDRVSLAPDLPNSRTAMIEDAGHWVHHDQLDQFLRVVREFFAEW